jgi:hypothetical protein
MKKAGLFAAGLALAASTVVATPTFGAQQDGCSAIRDKIDQLEVRLAHRGGRAASKRILGQIYTLRAEARILHCHL